MTEQTEPVTCPECGALMHLRDGKYGAFYGCSTWPKCKATRDPETRAREPRLELPSERMKARDRQRWRQ